VFQLTIDKCLRDEVDDLSDALEERGALSVTMTDRFDSPILEPEIGTTPLWADVVIQAIFAGAADAQSVVVELEQTHPHLALSVEVVPEKDWERVCIADFKPQQFGKQLWICPSWLTPPDQHAINLTLDPGLAFGTGTHPTTSLCLTWLEQASLTGKDVIDFGCGSGVLAIAALKLGARHVVAVDLDEQALVATSNNAQLNELSTACITIGQPTILAEPCDVLIANILLTPLLQLQPEFLRLLKPSGTLVLSGILNEQVGQLVNAYQQEFSHIQTRSQEDWSLVVLSR
jgi:ribosomal protein L11 methyltransferase